MRCRICHVSEMTGKNIAFYFTHLDLDMGEEIAGWWFEVAEDRMYRVMTEAERSMVKGLKVLIIND